MSVGGSRKARRPRLCVGHGDARGASNLTDRDALGRHFAVERGMADAVAVLELLDCEKLGHLGFQTYAQAKRSVVGLPDLIGDRQERSDRQQLRLKR